MNTGPLDTVALSDVHHAVANRVTSPLALPLYAGMLTTIAGPPEVGKTWAGSHAVLDVAQSGRDVLVLDGEMTAGIWRARLEALGADSQALRRVRYSEMSTEAADIARVRETWQLIDAHLVVWDSALSLISRTAQSENDNAAVSRVYDRLRDIVRGGPAGLIIDHVSRGSTQMVSRGASAKFAALDMSYGLRLADGAAPSRDEQWSAVITVEKDRHGLLPNRNDMHATFVPLGNGQIAIDISHGHIGTNRLTQTTDTDILRRITELDPPPRSGNDAFTRIGGHRKTVLDAYRIWKDDAA